MMLKKIINYNNHLFLWGFFVLAFNLFIIRLPLTNTFGYEFAAVNGLIFVLISGLLTLNTISKVNHHFSDLFINLFVLLIIPLLIIIIKSLLTMFCSFWDGLFFYVLIVTASTMFGCAIALIIDLIFNRFRKTFYLLIVLLIASIPVFEIYFLPQVYFYSPLIGFFPGNIYDEGLSPDWKLLLHQFVVFIFATSIIIVFLKYRRFLVSKKILFVILILVLSVAFQFGSTWFGFSTTYSSLDKKLSKQISSKQITLHYDNLNKNEADYVGLCADYYYRELEKTLKVKPTEQIHIYLFNNRQQKKELFGAGNADVAKPWQYAIYISADSWEHTLKHELVHIFSAEFGTGPFKLASGFNPALIEGIAEAIEGTTDEIALKDFTALAYNHNHKINLNSLFSGLNFFKSNSSLAYTYSGAFIKFLIEKYRIEKVKEFYASGDFNSAFNSDLNLEKEQFEAKLKASSFGNQAMADYYFGRLSIIQKVCPRYVSDRLNDAFDYLEDDNLIEAKQLFKVINDKTLNYSAIIGLSEIYLKENKIVDGIKLVKNNINKFANSPYYYNLIFRLGDLYASDLQNDSSMLCFNKIVSENPNQLLKYLSITRISLLETNKLYSYLDGNDSLKLNLLLELNRNQYHYNSLPIIIDILIYQKANYKTSLNIFNKTFIVDNLESSYAAFKLSQYMLANGDYVNGRKYAALSLRFKDKNQFYTAMKENFEKANWFFTNASRILKSFNNIVPEKHS